MDHAEYERKRKLDEALTIIHDILPSSWKSIYDRCIEEGFEKEQAFSILKTYILSQCPAGVHVHKD